MSKEIERKYLVDNDSFLAMATDKRVIKQGYLSTSVKATVRVRIANDHAYLTVKSKVRGIERDEWEYDVPLADAEGMMALCMASLEKVRYIVPYEGFTWEVDVFGGRLEGLILAEVELPDSSATPPLPPFVGTEVTGQPQYYNSSLARCQ